MNFSNVIKLWKAMLQLQEIETDKAKLIVESELAEGVEVFVEKEEGYVPAEDGEYETEDKIIVVAEGKVTEIREKEVKPEEVAQEDEPKNEDEPKADEPDERDAKIAEMQAQLDELNAIIAERDAKIAELEALLAEKQAQLEMSAEEPAKEKVKKEERSGALRYF